MRKTDIFFEYLVKKKSGKDVLCQIGVVLACIVLCILVCYLAFFHFRGMVAAVPLLLGAMIYGTVILRRRFSVEYEYTFTNGTLDIDVIYGKTTRKSVVSLACRNITYMGPLKSREFDEDSVIDVIYNENRRGKYVIDCKVQGKQTHILIQPPQKLLDYMYKYNPRNVHIA